MHFQPDKYVHKIEDKEEVEEVETTEQLLLRCPFCCSKRIKLFENVEIIESNFLNLNAKNQVFTLFYGSQTNTSKRLNHDILHYSL